MDTSVDQLFKERDNSTPTIKEETTISDHNNHQGY